MLQAVTRTGEPVEPGATVTDHGGKSATLVAPRHGGKLLVQYPGTLGRTERYAWVFGLRVQLAQVHVKS